MTGASFRNGRRFLTATLRDHRTLLATSAGASAAFEAAERSLGGAAADVAWCHRVCVDQFDLTFWLLPTDEARRRGAIAKVGH